MCRAAWVAVIAFFAALPARADDGEAAARAVLDRAVKAMGGARALAGFGGVTFQAKGTLDIVGQKIDITSSEWAGRGLDDYRWEATASQMGRVNKATILVTRGDVWVMPGNGGARKLPAEIAGMFLPNLRCVRLVQDPTLLRNKGVKLSPLGELKINTRDTVGIKITRKGQPDVDVFFDKKTGLPYKTEQRIKEGKDGQEVVHAFLFEEFKDAGGVKHFTKLTFQRDGMTFLELECSDIKPQEKLDDSLFTPPAKESPR